MTSATEWNETDGTGWVESGSEWGCAAGRALCAGCDEKSVTYRQLQEGVDA